MDIVYRANDGKEFDSEDECIDYERKIKLHTFKIWDVEANRLTNYGEEDYGKIFYINIADEKEMDDVWEEFTYSGFERCGLKGPGLYCYDMSTGDWLDCDKLLKQYQEEIDRINEVKKDAEIH